MWYIYTIAIIFFIFLILKAYFKVRNPFWNSQPVHQMYDIFSRFKSNTVIHNELIPANQYVNIINVKTTRVAEMSEEDVKKACDFISTNFLREKDYIEYKPTKDNIMGNLTASNNPSYINIYKHPTMRYNADTKQYVDEDEYYSVMTARPLNITLDGVPPFPTYYVDHLCVLPEMRGKGVAAKSIQTFYYNVSRDNPKINTYIFKREGRLTGIVPLTIFNIKAFNVINIPNISFPHDAYKLIKITRENIPMFVEFINRKKGVMKCTILPEITNLLNNIKLNNLVVYGIFLHGDLISSYIFRDAATFYLKKRTSELLCSAEECDTNIFVAGFTQAIHQHYKETHSDNLIMDETGANIIVTNYLSKVNINPFIITNGAYYFYNYIAQTIPPSKCFILA